MNNKKASKLVKENKNLKDLTKEGLELAEKCQKEAKYWKDMCKYLDICTRGKDVAE